MSQVAVAGAGNDCELLMTCPTISLRCRSARQEAPQPQRPPQAVHSMCHQQPVVPQSRSKPQRGNKARLMRVRNPNAYEVADADRLSQILPGIFI